MDEDINKNERDETLSFSGKIAVVTDTITINEDDFHSPEQLITKYGSEKIIHKTWPENFLAEQDKMINILEELAKDTDIKILIINQAVPGTNAAVDKLKKIRNDIFIVYCKTNEATIDAATRANLVFSLNELNMGQAMVKQAKKQGAKSFVHYSFPRHMKKAILNSRLKKIQATCLAESIQFIDATAPDPAGEAGISNAQAFLLDDVPKLVAKYGKDTAFFGTTCTFQAPLIKAVLENHAIYPQPCCPSPYHGFPEALGIKKEGSRPDLHCLIGDICRIVEEKNMTDRLSSWPVSASTMFTSAGAEYAIMRLNGTVLEAGIDSQALMDCMNKYVENAIGEQSCVLMNSLVEDGITYDNIKLVLMGYLDF